MTAPPEQDLKRMLHVVSADADAPNGGELPEHLLRGLPSSSPVPRRASS